MGANGSAARGAFSVKRRAIPLPSGDHWGSDREPVRSVSLRAFPPTTSTMKSCARPDGFASDRKANCLLSGDQDTSFSEYSFWSSEALIRRGATAAGGVSERYIAVLSPGTPFLSTIASTQATYLPSGEIAT